MNQFVNSIPCNTYQIKIPDIYSAGNQKQNRTMRGLQLLKKVKRIYSSLHERGLDIYILIQLVSIVLLMFI